MVKKGKESTVFLFTTLQEFLSPDVRGSLYGSDVFPTHQSESPHPAKWSVSGTARHFDQIYLRFH